MNTQTAANRLAQEQSPYLKSTGHPAVNWRPWSHEAFQEAGHLDLPVLLDIGAVWCHWCHVMDRESYKNEETVRFINEHFIAVKVDRDERPDIDSRYQLAVSALTGQGGWPLTAFLTPDGDVFFGGTYFPPEDRYGRPGFKTLLKRIVEIYRTRRIDVLEDAKKISAGVTLPSPPSARETPPEEVIQNALHSLKYQFDFTHGGLGNAPKFYHPSAFNLLLNQYFSTRESWMRSVIEKSLIAMGKGGVCDQLGGGFHRYSVDERWVVPHFEKLSCDNAAMLAVYSKAFQVLGHPFFEETARGILRWARESMRDMKNGGFYASQDADLGPHDDGDYYTWTLREAESLLTKEEAEALLPHFHIEEQGEMLHDPSRNVLHVMREPEVLARELELRPQEVLKRLDSARKKLLEARKKRKTPFVDTTLYTNWNGMWIRGFFAAWRAFHDPELKAFALKTLGRFMATAFDPGKGMVRWLREEKGEGEDLRVNREGLLEDQAEILAALIEAFEITAARKYLDFAKNLAELLIERFWAPDGGFYDTPKGPEEGPLRFRQRRIQDSPTQSANATAALALLRLHALTQNEAYLKKVEEWLWFFSEEAKKLHYFAAGYLNVLEAHARGPVKVTVAGWTTDERFSGLHETALFTFRPHVIISPLTEELRNPFVEPALDLVFQEAETLAHPVALVCRGKTCQPLTASPADLSKQILEIV